MSTRFAAAAALFVALVTVPAAFGSGPMPYTAQGGTGVLGPAGRDGPTRYVAIASNSQANTILEAIRTSDGTVWKTLDLAGAWGIPMVTYGQSGDSLTRDGKTLVLGDAVAAPRTESRFLVVDARKLSPSSPPIVLKGDFAFDAVSPDARKLYLIQHIDQADASRYVVRGYDLRARRLLPGRIADRTQKSWVMRGYPISRTTTADGHWVYTLYQNPGGYAFVHALDTVRGVAHCIGIPWSGSQNGFYNLRLSLRNHDRTLAVHWLSGRPWFAIDTTTWRVSHDSRAGFAWLPAGAGAGAALAGVAALLLRRRRRRRDQELEEELGQLLGASEREVVV